MSSLLIRNSVTELKRLKEEAKVIATQKMISEASQKIEEQAKLLMEQILQDKADDEESSNAELPVASEEPADEVDPVLTTLPAGDDFNIDAAPEAAGENEVTPTVTTTTDDQGNVDIVIDTNPVPEEDAAAALPAGLEGLPIEGLPTEAPLDGGAEETPNPEIEELDMTDASAEEIMEKFCETEQNGTLAEISVVDEGAWDDLRNDPATNVRGAHAQHQNAAGEARRGEVKGPAKPYTSAENKEMSYTASGTAEFIRTTPSMQNIPESTEDDELASYLDEALKMAESCDETEEEEVQELSEAEMSELEARLNEDQLDDMDGEAVPPRGNTGTTNIMGDEEDALEETIARNHTNGRHKNIKDSNFPEEKMRPGSVNEAVAKAKVVAMQKQLAESIDKLVNENKALKEQVSSLTSLNEGLEGDNGQYRSKFYEAMLLSYKTGHVNKLLMEQTTTKDEKEQILESFLNAGSREEVTQLYENFEKKLQKGGKTSLQEGKTVADKLAPVFTQEASSESKVLNESRSQDPKVQRMMRIINYNYNG